MMDLVQSLAPLPGARDPLLDNVTMKLTASVLNIFENGRSASIPPDQRAL